MAVSNTPHFGLLNRWPVVLREDLWRFNQIAGEGVHVAPGYPNNVFIQPERDYIAAALNEAVARSVPYLGFYPRPVYIEETIPLTTGTRWDWLTLETSYGYVQAFGRRAVELIAADVPLTPVDSNGDDTDDLVECTIPTTVDASEVQVFFREADGAPAAAHEQWRIEPVQVIDNGATVTIRGHRALFAHPINVWQQPYTSTQFFNKAKGDTSEAEDFVDAVDVYRVYTDPANAAVLVSDPADSTAEVEVLPSIRDSYEGYFRLRQKDIEPVKPRQVKVAYQAGLPLDIKGEMQTPMEVALCRYANVLMPHGPNLSEHGLLMWQEDRKNLGELGQLTERDNLTPPQFGIVQGAYHMWQIIRAFQNPRKARQSMEKRA